jgi:hypothetical protein
MELLTSLYTKFNIIYKYPYLENPPLETPLSRTLPTILPNINIQPSDTTPLEYIHTYQLNNKANIREFNTIHNFQYNSYPIRPPKTPRTKKKYETAPDLETPRQKWATLIYVGKETTHITKIYLHTQKSKNCLQYKQFH